MRTSSQHEKTTTTPTYRRAMLALAAASLFLQAGSVHAQEGITATEIRIGMSNAHTGPAAGLGKGMKAGADAYIAKVNAAGGVHGRKLVLVLKDDGYEPAYTAAATEALIATDKVFALFGYVGTPTSSVAAPIAAKSEVPYLFPFTGAEFLRNPVNKWVFNVRASYYDETEAMVERLTTDLGVKKVAMFMQDDAFGAAVRNGVVRALAKRNMKIHAVTRFKRNSLEVDDGVEAMKQAQPEAVVFVGTYKQLAAIVKKAKTAGVNARFLTVSFIGTENFIAEAGPAGDGVYITQVMPSLNDASVPVVKDYLSDMRGANLGYTSLEGYVNAAVMVEALRKAGPSPTRAGFASALEGLSTDVGGMKISFSGTNHQGSQSVFLTRVQDGKAVPQQKMQ